MNDDPVNGLASKALCKLADMLMRIEKRPPQGSHFGSHGEHSRRPPTKHASPPGTDTRNPYLLNLRMPRVNPSSVRGTIRSGPMIRAIIWVDWV